MKKKFSHVIAHYLPQCLLLISLLTSNVLFPATVIAQEIENTNNVTQEETVPIDTSEDILEEGISTSVFEETEVETEKEIIEEEEVVEPLFVFENGIYTVNTVVEGEEYVYPDNNDVRVKFTEVTQEGNLVIKRVELTEEQKELLNTKDNYGWDITSSMENGTFKYNLTLPNTQGNEDIEVKYTEDNNTYESIDNSNIEIKSNVVTIEGLDHFTLFVVVDDGENGYSDNGWSPYNSGYKGDHKWVTSSQTDKTATWTYTGTGISNGAVFLSWTIWDDHATNATYTLLINGSSSQVVVDQKKFADKTNTGANGTWSGWHRVPGEFNISTDSTVTLSPISGTTNGNLSADAVAFVDLDQKPNEVWVDDSYPYKNNDDHFFGYDAFNNIQDGVNAVASGGTVHVASGTYKENITIGKSLTLESINGVTSTIIDGSSVQTSAAIYISANSVTVRGFTIQNVSDDVHGAIYLDNSKNSAIENNTFLNNSGHITIYPGSDNTTVTGNILNGGYSGIDGWGIWVYEASNNNISSNTITGIKSSYSGAIYLQESNGNTIYNNKLTNNSTLHGIEFYDSDYNEVSKNEIIKNKDNTPDSTDGGLIYGVGIYLFSSTHNTLLGNTVKEQNSAIGLNHNSDNNKIEKNTLTENYNGIHFISSDCKENIIRYNEIYNNKNPENNIGRGIYFQFPSRDNNSNVINFNSIYGNPTAGVFYEGSNILNAKYNWWGDGSGPYNLTTNPLGMGDKVSNNVGFCPWLDAKDGDPFGPCIDLEKPTIKSIEYFRNNQPITQTGTGVDPVYVKSVSELSYNASFSDDLKLSKHVFVIYDENPTNPGTPHWVGNGGTAYCSFTGTTNTFALEGKDDSLSNVSFDNCTTELPEGRYVVVNRVYDAVGKFMERYDLTFVVDKTAPEVKVTSHNDGDFVHGTVTITGKISDTNLSHYWFVVVDSNGTEVAGPKTVPSNNENITASFIWDTTTVDIDDGQYTIKLEAKDLAGNKDPNEAPVLNDPEKEGDSVDWVIVTVDNTPPEVLFANQVVPEILTELPLYQITSKSEDLLGDPVCTIDEGITFPIDAESENNSFTLSCTYSDLAGNTNTSTYKVTVTNVPVEFTLSATKTEITQGDDDIVLGTNITNGNSPYTYLWSEDCTGTGSTTTLSGDSDPGDYTCTVTVTDADGDTATDSIDITVGAVLGATDGATTGYSTTSTTKPTTTKTNVSTYALGTGSGKDTLEQGEEILETTSIIEEPSVLGERCENKKKVSGYVYIDKNKDKEMNDNEEGIKDITLTIQYTDEEGNIKTEEEVNTDEKGYWETQLCSGKYNIVVKKDTLPKNIEVSEVLSLTVSDNEEETIFNIQALDTRNFWQKYWYLIVGGLAIIVIGYISIKNRKKEEI